MMKKREAATKAESYLVIIGSRKIKYNAKCIGINDKNICRPLKINFIFTFSFFILTTAFPYLKLNLFIMRKKIFFSSAVLLLLVIVLLSWHNRSNNHQKKSANYFAPSDDNRPVIAIRKMKLKAGASEEEFNKLAHKIAHKEFGALPGVKEYIAKGERGDEVGSYIYVIEFDSKKTRDFYYPKPGSNGSDASADAKKFMQSLDTTVNQQFGRTGRDGSGGTGYTDYLVFE
jgi:hypothetical protein